MNDQSAEAGLSYATDAPLSAIEQDRFNRASFSSAIAEGIAATKDSSSIVIGIYGPWGDGKTTVLNFIEQKLQGRPRIISMQFNPWRYQTEEILLVGFFNALANILKAKLALDREKAAKQFADLFKLIPKVGDVLSAFSKKYGDLSVEEFKRRIEDILVEKQTRLVVLMDDIDRLSLEEVQASFRLIKLSGSLKYITYVLAFDDKMVAAALKQRYISDEETGHGFLEKIVQVPLRLPKTPKEVLLGFCRERIEESTESLSITLDTAQSRLLDEYFGLFSELLQTPRQCKRIDNALIFAFALLKGEANAVDLIVIETLRALAPKLYEIIRSNGDYFLGRGTLSRDVFEKRVIEPALSGTSFQARQNVHEVLKKLFPAMVATRNAYAQIRPNPYDDLADDQRVASEYYFERFFTYNVPLTEVRDSQIGSVIAGIDTREVKETGAQLQKIIKGLTSAGPDHLIDKLSLRRKLLDVEVSRKLAPALCSIGHNFEGLVERGFPFSHPSDAALLVRQLVLNVPRQVWGDPPLNWRNDTIKQMLDVCPIEARAILFLYWCLVTIGAKNEEQKSYSSVYRDYPYSSGSDSEPLISNDEFAALNPQLADKINKVHQSGYLYDFKNRRVSRDLVDVWIRCSSSQQVGDLVQNAVQQDPKRAIAVVRWYIDSIHSVDTFTRDLYDRIHSIINSSILLTALSKDFANSWSEEIGPDDPRKEELKIAKAYRWLVDRVEHQTDEPFGPELAQPAE
jgi:hypothetical protein